MPASNTSTAAPAPTQSNVEQKINAIAQEVIAFGQGRQTPAGIIVPKESVHVNVLGYAQSPAYGSGNQVQICQYQVKPGWYSLICGVVLGFTGSGPSPLPGDIIYTIDIDRPLGDSTAGYGEKDYTAVGLQLGSLQFVPWPVEFKHQDGEIIRVKAYTTGNVGTGVGNWITAALIGYEWAITPREG